MRISDWSSDVCSSDLDGPARAVAAEARRHGGLRADQQDRCAAVLQQLHLAELRGCVGNLLHHLAGRRAVEHQPEVLAAPEGGRSEEHTSELQSLMRISYAVFCLTKKKKKKQST